MKKSKKDKNPKKKKQRFYRIPFTQKEYNEFTGKAMKRNGSISVLSSLIAEVEEKYVRNKLSEQILTEAYCIRGTIYAKQQRYEEAISDYTQAIELKGDYAEAYNNRGVAYFELRRYKEVIIDYTQVIELKKDYAEAYFNRGNAYFELKIYDEAIIDYIEAIDLKKDYVEAYVNRGTAYLESNRYDEAIIDYTKVIKIDKNYIKAYFSRGVVYAKQRRYEEVIGDFDKVIDLKKDYEEAYEEAYVHRGTACLLLRRYEEAISDFDKAIYLKKDYEKAYFGRGNTYVKQQRYEEAISDFDKAIELKGDDANAYYNRGTAYFEVKKYKEAKKSYSDSFRYSLIQTESKTRSKLYHYRPLNKKTLRALRTGELWLANPKNFNDPLDGEHLRSQLTNGNNSLYQALDELGMICFEGKSNNKKNEKQEEIANKLMWSHYADGHEGICLVFEQDYQELSQNNQENKAQCVIPIEYKKERDLNIDEVERLLKVGYTHKHEDWDYENEYRLLRHQTKLGKGQLISYSDLGLTLTQVIFGLRCNSKVNQKRVRKKIKNNNVKYYQVKYTSSLHSLDLEINTIEL